MMADDSGRFRQRFGNLTERQSKKGFNSDYRKGRPAQPAKWAGIGGQCRSASRPEPSQYVVSPMCSGRTLEKVARPERFELPTLWFEARCSIQLSYGRADESILRYFAPWLHIR